MYPIFGSHTPLNAMPLSKECKRTSHASRIDMSRFGKYLDRRAEGEQGTSTHRVRGFAVYAGSFKAIMRRSSNSQL